MSASSGSQAMPGWYWPDDVPKDEPPHATSSSSSSQPQPSRTSATGEAPHAGQGTRSSRRTHWPPRQCRICLETVQPTFNVPSENLPGFLQSSNVKYEDESGRLIRPCNCKGSSKYVHEACLQAWRHADPSYGPRNYWQCPTCGFKYRLVRLGAGRFVGSVAAQVGLTLLILTIVVFVLGFIADPIINMYFDPWSYLMPWSSRPSYDYYEDEPVTWGEHFAKGFASMGVLGFLKVLVASPFSYFRLGGGGGRGRNGRDRYEQISWIIILVGVGTFLAAVYKGVRAWSRRTLERAGERVMDVQGDDDDDEE
ncbi:RING finger domain-containing protein [Dothidotthia symphoricarpi CBS 119687]|uniref:RING finger domain-containing protein n=1 Tax=Dothidotthia symphoricarpi CBS 119687 TaxID=1392245 RepID=A0A6A6AIL0_9PLEO|nr:RING finger domain-containing protein [Dothidotthia symphoricarpi CBS 119687]KAF2130747.1 RING finger domain-containing protein [Dothidotthia symphoricarpi CBS 119687]